MYGCPRIGLIYFYLVSICELIGYIFTIFQEWFFERIVCHGTTPQYVSFGLLSTITEDVLFKNDLLLVWYYDYGWIWIFLFYESGSPQLFREKNNIQDENENMIWRIESFVYLWKIGILFGFRFQHTNKEIFVLFSTFRLWTRSINIYYSHFTGFFGSCWNIFLELNWWRYIWWMLYIRVTVRGGQKGRCRGLSASATFPLSLPFQPLTKAVFCRHEPVSLSSLP